MPRPNQDTEPTPESHEVARQGIIDANIGTILHLFPYIDPKYQDPRNGENQKRSGIMDGDMMTIDGHSEISTRIIYNTATGEIVYPGDFFAEDALLDDRPFVAGQFSAIDTWLVQEGPLGAQYPDARYWIRLQLPELAGAPPQEMTQRDSLDPAEASIAAMYRKIHAGNLVQPRRLLPGVPYNSGVLHEPWGEALPETFRGVSEAYLGEVSRVGDGVMRDTILKFNQKYGSDALKALSDIW